MMAHCVYDSIDFRVNYASITPSDACVLTGMFVYMANPAQQF